MPVIYRVGKAVRPVFNPTGAFLEGGRWNSPGRRAIYASTCLAGSLLELLVHTGMRQKLPGEHHCARAEIPDDVRIEVVDETRLPGWDAPDSVVAREVGDDWLATLRTAVLSVPAVTAKPYGRHVVLNPVHPDFTRISIGESVPIEWDARLLRV
jgi:RES domain-containing protein